MIHNRRIRRWLGSLAALVLLVCICVPPASAGAERGVVRVLLTQPAITDRLTVSLDGSYTLGELCFQRGSRLILAGGADGVTVYYEGMALNAGKEARLIRHALNGNEENGIRLNETVPLYCGDLYVRTNGSGLTAVLHIPVEEYLLGVVPYEMSDSFPLEALKAQAVAARTYALRRTGGSGQYDVEDNTNDQVYRGYQKQNTNAVRAVAETEGVCGYDHGALANCYYTASNGGQVELPQNVWNRKDGAYITQHEDPYDVENPESVVKKAWISKKPNDTLGNAALTEAVKAMLAEPLAAKGYTGEAEDIRIMSVEAAALHTPKFGAESLVMTQLRLTLRVEARRLRSAAMPEDEEMSIFQVTGVPVTASPAPSPSPTVAATASPVPKSPFEPVAEALTVDVPVFTCLEKALRLSINGAANEIYSVEEKENGFEISARRYGHGVGMSQRGAQWLAGKYNWTYEQILRFYYPGLSFQKTDTKVTLPPAIDMKYLATPGPAATATPRPTLMPVTMALGENEYKVQVTQIGVNSYLNLRSAPGTDAEVLRQLYYGQVLIVTAQLPDGWLKVKTDAADGYVMEQFVERIKE